VLDHAQDQAVFLRRLAGAGDQSGDRSESPRSANVRHDGRVAGAPRGYPRLRDALVGRA
jgi:hypothetical protein